MSNSVGLVGDGWLYLLEMAKRNVVQAGAAVVPAAATLYCAGVELPPSSACGFDLTALDKYRSEHRRVPTCLSMSSQTHTNQRATPPPPAYFTQSHTQIYTEFRYNFRPRCLRCIEACHDGEYVWRGQRDADFKANNTFAHKNWQGHLHADAKLRPHSGKIHIFREPGLGCSCNSGTARTVRQCIWRMYLT